MSFIHFLRDFGIKMVFQLELKKKSILDTIIYEVIINMATNVHV